MMLQVIIYRRQKWMQFDDNTHTHHRIAKRAAIAEYLDIEMMTS